MVSILGAMIMPNCTETRELDLDTSTSFLFVSSDWEGTRRVTAEFETTL